MRSNCSREKKAYPTMAFAAVTIIALLYGISPTWYAATFLGITGLNPNVAHFRRQRALTSTIHPLTIRSEYETVH